ncbi:MAG: MFS transporter [Candidatus Thorarchaeota archaeon]
MKKREITSIILFLILLLLLIMDKPLFLPNEVLIAADLNVYLDSIGLVIGIHTLINGISILLFGYYSDKFSRKDLLIFAGVSWALVSILHIYVSEFWHLILIRIFSAITIGITGPLAISYLADIISPKSRSKSFAFWGLISFIAEFAAGYIALGFNIVKYGSITAPTINEKIDFIRTSYPGFLHTWTYPYFFIGIFALIFVMLNYFFTIEPKRAGKEKDFEKLLSQEERTYSYRIKFSDLKYIYKRKSNFFLTMNFFDVIASGLLVAFLFPYIELEIGVEFLDIRIILFLLIVIIFGLLIGQFFLAHWGDRKVQRGDPSGRIKVAVIVSILTLPFMLFAIAMTPNISNQTFFLGSLDVNNFTFWILWLIFSAIFGIGLAFTMGIGPNWYSSLVDINLPENRGTMVAIGTFIDSIGRALGAIIGGISITITNSISLTLFWSTLIFGIISICFWIPLFYTSKKDFREIEITMKQRAEKILKRE